MHRIGSTFLGVVVALCVGWAVGGCIHKTQASPLGFMRPCTFVGANPDVAVVAGPATRQKVWEKENVWRVERPFGDVLRDAELELTQAGWLKHVFSDTAVFYKGPLRIDLFSEDGGFTKVITVGL